jgi:hypothetical protein
MQAEVEEDAGRELLAALLRDLEDRGAGELAATAMHLPM